MVYKQPDSSRARGDDGSLFHSGRADAVYIPRRNVCRWDTLCTDSFADFGGKYGEMAGQKSLCLGRKNKL